jgi:anti-anti-sigma factor
MSQVSLSLSVLQVSESVAVMALEGVITAAAEAAMIEALEHAGSKGTRSIILDFAGVSGLDSGGASVLVKFYISSKRHQVELAAAGPKSDIKDVFRLTGLEEVMSVHDTRSAALSAKGISAETPGTGGPRRFEVASEFPAEVKRGGALNWAKPVDRLRVTKVTGSVSTLNVEGRRTVGPIRGFGQMWEKTYELRFSDAKKTPVEIAATTKENFVRFQPPQNNFYPTPAGIKAGETVLIRSSVLGVPILTGVLVSYADDVSFTFMTPQGHPESGWVTFRVFQESNETVCQIQGLARANDPIYEIAFRLHGSKFQEQTWMHVLGSLAKHLDVKSQPTMKKRLIAPNMQWSQMGNVRHNAQLWTLAYLLIWPLRRVVRIFRK